MKNFSTPLKLVTVVLLLLSGNYAYSQCSTCTATTVNVNLSSTTDTAWTYSGVRSGNCCTGSNCIVFNVTLNPGSDLLSFNVTNPAPSGAAFYQINCGPQVSIGTPACVNNQTQVCITYCKPGGDSPIYHITATKTVQASADISIREGCAGTLSVNGMQTSTITWNSVFPGTPGQYNSYLSCTAACATTTVTPAAGAPAYVDYVVSGNPNTSCPGTSTDTIRVYITPGMTAAITPANPVICAGSSTINLTATATGGAPPYSYLWNTGATTQTIAAGVGTYIAYISDTSSSCPPVTDTVVVTSQPAVPTPVATNNGPVCAGSTLNLFASTISGATYSWTGPNGFTSSLQNPVIPGATSAEAGVYSVVATVNGCSGSAGSTTVTVNPIPSPPTASSNTPVCSGNSLNLFASTVTGATYNWTGPNGFTSSAQNPVIANPVAANAGTYSVTVTVNGCTSTAASTTVTVNPTPAAPAAGSNSPICAGGTINLTASAITGATYSWTGPNGFTSSVQNPSIASATAAASGVYSVTATVGGCTGPAGTTTVTVNPIPATPVASANSPVCQGSTLNLSTPAVTGATYSWTGPNGFTSSLQNPTIANITTAGSGTYSLTVTVNGCTSAAGTVAVTVQPLPTTPVVSSNSPVCSGNTLNLTATSTAGATYSWTGPNGFTSTLQNPSISGVTTAASGTYTVTASLNGCAGTSASTTVTINQTPAAPTAGANTPLCVGANLNLTASAITGATYSWTGPNGFTSSQQNPVVASVTSADAGTYQVTATVNGCTGPAGSVTVVVNLPPSAPSVSSNSPVCAGSPINLTTTATGVTYSWTGPNGFTSTLQNPVITNPTTAAGGTYSLVVNNGCNSTASTVNVTVNPTPAAPAAGSNSPICAGGTINLTASAITGATYSWTGPNGFTSSVQNPSIASATTAASGVYSVTATVGGCTGPAGTTTVTVNPIPATPVASANSPVCQGSTLNLSTPAVTGATYSWTGPNGFTSSLQNPTIANITTAGSGTYSLTVTVNGCTSAAGTVAVTVQPLPTTPVVSSNSPVCSGNTLNLTATSTAGATYAWTGPNGFTSTLQNPSISGVTTAASGTYTVTASLNGCAGTSASTTVTINQTPAAPTAGANTPLCVGANLNLTASAITGATYSWTGPNGFTSSQQNPVVASVTSADAGTYQVTATVNGCTGPAGSVTVVVNLPPSAPSVSSNSPVCAGSPINLTTTATGVTYSWTGPNGFTSTLQNPVITNPTTAAGGTYSLVVNNGCNSTASTVNVTVNPTPAAPTAGSNSPICAGGTINLTASAITGATYSWTGPNGFTSSSQNPTISGASLSDAGSYSVTATSNGCTGPAGTVTIVVNDTVVVSAGADISVCANNALAPLSGSITGGSVTGTWTSSGSGTFSPSASTLNANYIPSAADTTVGTILLTLTATNTGACPAVQDQLTLTITDAPVVNAGIDLAVCANNATISLNGNVAVASGGYWSSLGTGTFNPDSTALNGTYIPSNSDTAAGSVTFILTSTGNGQCNAVSDTMQAIITPAPVVNAGADQAICLISPNANLNGSVSGGTTTGNWSTLGTGTFSPSSASLNASYVPGAADTLAGTVTLVLTSTNNGGCAAVSDTVVLTYTNQPIVSAGTGSTVCANNAQVTLNGSVTGGASAGVWTTSGTGTFSPDSATLNAVYTPSPADTAAGSVVLTLSSTNGCVVITDQITINITPAPQVLAGPDQIVCSNNSTVSLNGNIFGGSTTGTWTSSGTGTFQPSSSALTATYLPSNGDTAAGSVVLVLTSTNNGNCLVVSDTVNINIIHPPSVFAGPDLTMCANDSLQLTGTISGGSGTGIWSSSGTGLFIPSASNLNAIYVPSAADTTSGSVTLFLTSTNNGNCFPSSDTLQVTITDAPIANAGPDQAFCANNPFVNLSGSVSIASGGVWSTLGTGIFADDSSLVTTYTPDSADIAAGSVTIVLTTTGNGLCNPVSDSVIINVSPAPVVNAGNDVFICTGTTTAQINGSVSGGSTTGTWSTLGSGTFTSPGNLSTTYNLSAADTTAGFVYLVLTSTNNGNCNPVTDTVMVGITTVPTTTAGTGQTVCANNALVNLNGTVTGGSGLGVWSTSGDGTFVPSDSLLSTSYLPGPTDTATGSVWLVLTPQNSCLPLPDSLQITITPAPFVNAGPDTNVCFGNAFNLNGLTNGISGGVKWTTNGGGNFLPNDSVMSVQYVPASTDTLLTTLYVILESTGNGNCVAAVDTAVLTIGTTPVADFTFGPACQGESVAFNDASTVFSGNVTQWEWTIGLSNYSTQNITHTFVSTGLNNITLVASSAAGCSDTITKSVYVNSVPVSSFSSLADCSADSAMFTDLSTVSGGTIIGWNWSFGDSATSTIQNPSHQYAAPGPYFVTLTVTSDSGCVATSSDTVNVATGPQAYFTMAGECTLGKTFADSSIAGSNPIISWTWNMGDGSTGQGQTVQHTFASSGTFNVALVVTSSDNCTDTLVLPVAVNDLPLADFSPAGGEFSSGEEILFTDLSSTASSWNWVFGDGSGSSQEQNPAYTFSQSGSYPVSLTITTNEGCIDSVSYVFEVSGGAAAVPSAFTPNADGVNDILYVRGGPFTELEFRIFNEWGNEIFSTNDPATGWDGTIDGKLQPSGTFIYVVTAIGSDGSQVQLKGDVTLLR